MTRFFVKAFEKAIKNTEFVNIHPELVDVFKKSMAKFHDYFEKNNLYSLVNVGKFFDDYLFTNRRTQEHKLTIDYIKYEDNDPNDYYSVSNGVRGIYFLNGNKLVMNEMQREVFDSSLESYVLGGFEESLIFNFVHEFSHYLTMCGKMEYMRGDQVETSSYYTQYSYVLKPHLNEMLTERFKTKIVGEEMLNYNPLVLPLKLIEEVFNINLDQAYLTRSYEEFVNKMGQENFNIFDEATKNVYMQFRKDENKVNYSKELKPIIDLAFKKINEELDNMRTTLTPTEFLSIRTKLYYMLPFKSFSDYNKQLDSLNEKFACFYLTKNNVELNDINVKEIKQIMSTAAKAATSLTVEQDYEADKFLRVKLNHININLLVKDGLLLAYNHDMENFYCIKDLVLLKDTNESEIKKFDTVYPCLQDYKVRYVKHSEHEIDIYEYNDSVPEGQEDKHNCNKKISLTFKNNTITLKGNEKTVSFDLYDKQNAQIVDSLNSNLKHKVSQIKENTPLLLK